MSTNPLPPVGNLAQDLRRAAATLTNDAQNAALRRCKELGFDTNKGLISLEETLINLSEARDMLLDAVDQNKLAQLPLRLQYKLYELARETSQQLSSLANGTDEITNLVDTVEDLTAEIWRDNLRNLSGEVLGLHSKTNQLKAIETHIRKVSREAEQFSGLQEAARRSLDGISILASESSALKESIEAAAHAIEITVPRVTEQAQRISSFASQVDQHETTAMQQLANTKQAAADTEASARKAKELQAEVETDRAALADLLAQYQQSLSTHQESLEAQLKESKAENEKALSATNDSIAELATKLDETIVEKTEGINQLIENTTASLRNTEAELKRVVTELSEETSARLSELKTEHDERFTAQIEELSADARKKRDELDARVLDATTKFVKDSKAQLNDQLAAFNAQMAASEEAAKLAAEGHDNEHKRLVAALDELEGRIRESIERATGYSLFQSFQKRQLDIAKAKRFWGGALGAIVAISLIASGIFIYELRYVQVYNAAFYLKLSISIPLIYAIAFCNLQYSRERRLEEEYAFKSNISVSLEPYQKLVDKLVDKTKPEELSKYTAFVIESVNRVYTSPTSPIFEPAGDANSTEKLIKALGEFIEPVIKGLRR